MSETGVRWRHVLRHAVLPGLTLSGWALGALISAAVIVEVIFVRPGLGQVLVNAVSAQDLPVVVGVTMFVAAVYVRRRTCWSTWSTGSSTPRLRRAVAMASTSPDRL